MSDLSAKQYLLGQVQQKLAAARGITEAADAAGRQMTEEEVKSVEATLNEVAKLKTDVSAMEDTQELRSMIEKLGNPTVPVSPEDKGRPTKSHNIGEAFVSSPEFKALSQRGFDGSWTTGPVHFGGIKAPLSIDGQVVLDEGDGSGGVDTGILVADTQAGIQAPGTWPLTIADLFAPGTTTSPLVRYLREIPPGTNGASGVPEAGVKPASTFTFEAVDEPVKKIATFLPVTDEMLEDVAQISSYLNSRLSLFVRTEEEAQLINGGGTDDLVGILQRTNVGNVNSGDYDNLFDAVLGAIVSCRTEGFLNPDAVVINPVDDASLRTSKAGTTGNYFGGGPYAPGADNPWGVRAVVTTAIDPGTILVGAFRAGGQIFRRSGLTVEASNSHKDWFGKNLTAIRAEERLALAVYREEAFCTVTLTS